MDISQRSATSQPLGADSRAGLSRRNRAIVAILALLAIAGGGAAIYHAQRPVVVAPGLSPFANAREHSDKVPVLFDSPSFDFVDQQGRRTLDSGLRGRIWIADFIFTHCAGQCLMVTAKMVELQKAIQNPDVRFVSFSVDPDNDDPQTLKRYAHKHNTAETRWVLLRPPDRKTVVDVAKHMAALTPAPDNADVIAHTDAFVLIDAQGRVRGLYDSKDPNVVERLKGDVEKVARQELLDRAAATGGATTRPVDR